MPPFASVFENDEPPMQVLLMEKREPGDVVPMPNSPVDVMMARSEPAVSKRIAPAGRTLLPTPTRSPLFHNFGPSPKSATLSPRRNTGSRCFLEGRDFVLSTCAAAPTAL